MNIKSLPSTYNGVTFRSRLEARWAALFDSYGIQWAHEPEGFETPSGNYLPDFYLPRMDTYVEVKPAIGLADTIAIASVHEQTGAKFLILDSPVVECRAFPLLGAWSAGVWSDTSWCCSREYLPCSWYVDLAVEHAIPAHSEACPNCHGDGLSYDGNVVRARSLRFENGVAR